MVIPIVNRIEAKTGVSRAALADSFLIALRRALAPYRGCGHGCRYCDGRAEKYFVAGDFERDIAVRMNLPGLVARDVAAGALSAEFGAIGLGSGVTDVYQPLEQTLGLTRQTLEALLPAGNPISVLTKGTLVLRDFDLLARFPKVLVMVTLTTLDPAVAAVIEPGAPAPAERLEVVRRARAAGFRAGIMAMPLCPGISDGEADFDALLDAAERAGAEFVWPGGLTLRPGRQKALFRHLVGEHWPALGGRYDHVFGENRASGMPRAAWSGALALRAARQAEARGMPAMPPFDIHRELLSRADSLFVLFCHMQELYPLRGVDTRPLRAATAAYGDWLRRERGALRRKRIAVLPGDPFPLSRLLDERLAALCAGGGFAEIVGNEKLARLARQLVLEGRRFDYPTLKVV
ncbi:MAG: hypothetical protein CGU28_08940 [Candidatus Dactylopiibacterium carminicum]|uniref:Radical SAM protein n=2 Tax=Candidatus Dactylopiibacterium carminicum TaxID=857335 RepID=A0A272EWE2_9RHOO|nr:radical SAM protein [Candidatus Dactylopiibacterium carminicum]PAS94411.1 MAG: hypothetical protein CGU29_03620 [Candidatus Dactylopiibacterium carminicum]PAS96426.1 MAG: hypothetical protein CGU28_08940 [Candidatus Dactylopiibacterium carminicum]PAS99572.1 MAG: hypothetical protein BSR46_07350 [Candidatus Dactylopiibacterium carminicum]